jgi:endonuclease/exonuclease/phosphatase (EEP) superfamily protein YafD
MDYEGIFLIFIANVFAPSILLLTVAVAALGELYAYTRKTRPRTRDRVFRFCLLLSAAVPTIAGELRSREQPRMLPTATAAQVSLLNSNLLGPRNVSDGWYEEITRLKPDIITLQELNPTVANELERRFAATYPCRDLQPHHGVTGMGILSRFPCSKRPPITIENGIGSPQFVDVTTPDRKTIGVINMHTMPPHMGVRATSNDTDVQMYSNTTIAREQYVQSLITHSRFVHTDAVILAGDLNATTRNRVYRRIRAMGLYDAFAVAPPLRHGTWPAPELFFPSWIVRIDFIFHCAGLAALQAETLPAGYGSDHRGIFTRLAFTQSGTTQPH